MLASFLLSMREGLEAALIVGITLGVLYKLGRLELRASVWSGAAAAVTLSVLAALGLNWFGMELTGRAEQLFEGGILLFAAGVLTWMIFWMRYASVHLKQEIETQTHDAVRGGGLFALAFISVFREGVELALFLLAVRQTASPLQTVSGALLGLFVAAILGVTLFSSTRHLNLKSFFNVTNLLLVVFAAGMVGVGIHEFNQAGVIPALIEHVWDWNGWLNENSDLGLLLKALLGYNANPSLSEALGYLAYLVGMAAALTVRLPHKTAAAPIAVEAEKIS